MGREYALRAAGHVPAPPTPPDLAHRARQHRSERRRLNRDDVVNVENLGLVAGVLTTGAGYLRSHDLASRSAEDLSWPYLAVFASGVSLGFSTARSQTTFPSSQPTPSLWSSSRFSSASKAAAPSGARRPRTARKSSPDTQAIVTMLAGAVPRVPALGQPLAVRMVGSTRRSATTASTPGGLLATRHRRGPGTGRRARAPQAAPRSSPPPPQPPARRRTTDGRGGPASTGYGGGDADNSAAGQRHAGRFRSRLLPGGCRVRASGTAFHRRAAPSAIPAQQDGPGLPHPGQQASSVGILDEVLDDTVRDPPPD